VVKGGVESMPACGFVAVNWGDGGVIGKMISGHEPGRELTPTDTCDAQNGTTGVQ
jgi:hypothetical protein